MADLLVISGPPGAGKSTVGKRVAHGFARSVLVKGDDFFGSLAAGAILPWLPEADEQNVVVFRAAAAATGSFVKSGYDTIYEGVVGVWHLPQFLAAAQIDALHYAVLLPSEEVWVHRVTTRLDHGFTDLDATRRVHRDFVNAEVAPRHVLADPPDEIAGVVDLIRTRMADGSLLYGGSV